MQLLRDRLQRVLGRRFDELLGCLESDRGAAGDRPCQVEGARLELGARQNDLDESDLTGFDAADGIGGKDEPHRLSFADQPGKALRAAGAGHHGEAKLGETDRGVLGRDADVGREQQLRAAADGVPVDLADDRFGERLHLLEGAPRMELVVSPAIDGRGAFPVVDVRPCA